MNLLYIFLGGGLGSVVRYLVTLGVMQMPRTIFPVATLTSNILSCLVMGLVLQYGSGRIAPDASIRLLLITGFCGGFSTFSAFSLETLELFRGGHTLWAVANVTISIFACLGLLYALVRTA